METNYTFDITDNEVTFTEDYMKALFTPQEELILSIAESFNLSYVDAEEYAKNLKIKCLDEYRNGFKQCKRRNRRCMTTKKSM